MDILPQINALELTNPLLIPAEEEALVPIAARFPYPRDQNLIAASMYDQYSMGPSVRLICT